jgi:hypothetical protein
MLSRLAPAGRQPNLLIVCNERAQPFVTRQAAEWCQAPLYVFRLPGPLNLPASAHTILLNDVSALTMSQQIQLFDWMTHHVGTRVVSITSADLPMQILEGGFLEGLYYRLNTVRVYAKEGRDIISRAMQSR